MNPRAPAGNILSADELIGAFEALSPNDKLKLAAIEAIRRRGTGFAERELIHEAVCRMLMGERNCPRDVPFMAFMAQTMRSIAGHDREKRRRSKSVDDAAEPAVGASGAADSGAHAPSPEDILMDKQDAAAVREIHGYFDDDAEAQLVLLGLQDDLRGAALREATGLNQAQLDYAMKRIRIKMRKAYPQGWIK